MVFKLTVSWVDPPLGARPEMVIIFENTVRCQIPHLRVLVSKNILLHSERRFHGLVFPIPHGTELGNRFFNRTVTVGACRPRKAFTIASLGFHFGLYESRQYMVML